MTYAQAWDWYLGPALDRQNKSPRESGGGGTTTRQTGGFSPANATKEEMDAFLNQVCGNRVYEGPRWWVPGEVPGVKYYNGPDKESE